MAKNLLNINASETGITSKRSPHKYQKTTVLYENQKNSKTSYFWSILNVFIYHHQLLYVHPVLFLLSKGYSIDTILHDFISVDFIVNENFKLLNRDSILLLFSFVFLPFCFLYFFSYYCLRYCCPIIIIVIYLLLLLFTHLFTYLFIHIYYIIYVFILWSWLV